MKALKFIKEAESNTEKAKAAAMANIMKQKSEIDAKNAEVSATQSYDINEPKYDMDEYKSLLSRHDWYYDYSDDHSVWTRGSNERKQLNSMQDAIDSDYAIWNEYAPDMFKRIKTAEGESKLPPHLAKLFNPDGTLVNPKAQARWEEIVRKHNTKKKLQNKWKVTDVTPPGYGPADESIESAGQNPYICVHAKKGKYECHADTTYGAAKQAAQHWKLKSTAGIDVHLADVEHTAEGVFGDVGKAVKDLVNPSIADQIKRVEQQLDLAKNDMKKSGWSLKDVPNLEQKLAKLKAKAGQPMESDISEGTDLGKLGNGVLLNQFNMGKGVVGLQLTSNKNTGYVHLDLDAAKDLQKKLNQWIGMRDAGELPRPGDMDEGFASDAQRKAAFANGYKPKKKKNEGLEESIENLESLTEAQFDEAAGEKDACYHKVKSRYKVWPSAYASGALVQCRKVGAENWGNKSKK